MQYLAPLDWIWLVLFVVLMILTGVFFYRLAQRSEEDFFLAKRGLPWWLPAMSVYATHTATDTAIFVTGVVFLHGVSGVWYVWSSVSHRFCTYPSIHKGSNFCRDEGCG